MKWREIRQNDAYLVHAAGIWRYEQTQMPLWFRAANSVWTRTETDFLEFCADCAEIWALFDEARLIACVYVERGQNERVATIHLSILAPLDNALFIERAGELRDMFFRRGVRQIRGWILRKNFGLAAVMRKIGFLPTDLVMDKGVVRERVARWRLFQVVRG